MGTTEVVIVAVLAVVALVLIGLGANRKGPWGEVLLRPYTAVSVLAPPAIIALVGTGIVLIANDKSQALFGSLVLLVVFTPIFVILTRAGPKREEY